MSALIEALAAFIETPLAERALLLDWEEAIEMDEAGGADAEECGHCDTYCSGSCGGSQQDRADNAAYDAMVERSEP